MRVLARIFMVLFSVLCVSNWVVDARPYQYHEDRSIYDLRRQKREQWEKINHKYAFSYALKLVDKTRKDITLKDILRMHYLILRNIDDERAGKLRRVNVRLLPQPQVKFPSYKQVPDKMNDFMRWLHTVEGDAVKIAIRAFCKLVLEIHPFADGNGRTARLFMNLLLMQAGYRPLRFHKKLNPAEYYDVYIPALNRVLFYKDYRDFDELIFSRLQRRTASMIDDEELALNYEYL